MAEIAWIESLEQGRELARSAQKILFLDVVKVPG